MDVFPGILEYLRAIELDTLGVLRSATAVNYSVTQSATEKRREGTV